MNSRLKLWKVRAWTRQTSDRQTYRQTDVINCTAMLHWVSSSYIKCLLHPVTINWPCVLVTGMA